MKLCIYCNLHKEEKDFTLEHAIPQFLGGAYASDEFKTRDVCGKCNSNLGLFVDAAFEKNWLVSNWLQSAAFRCFDPEKPSSIPLVCLGEVEFTPPGMPDDEVCECWLGPFGEQIFLVRPKDERLYWYVGGNPIALKNKGARAYFLFSENSHKNPNITWLSFRDAFERKKVKKIMCTTVEGADPREIGFSDPDELDSERIEYFKAICAGGEMRKHSLSMYINYDFRFMAKIAIGVAYSLFGSKFLESAYTSELRKALWYREGEPEPAIRGSGALSEGRDKRFQEIVGEDNAVSIVILPVPEGVCLSLSIGKAMNWNVMVASHENLAGEDIEKIKDGIAIVLFKPLQKGFKLALPDFISYKLGHLVHSGLNEISALVAKNSEYFKSLNQQAQPS